jgi:voltage-gated potassium channel
MTQQIDTAAPTKAPMTWEDRLAGTMFFLALLFLIALAGLIHRYPRLGPDDLETHLMLGVLAGLWLVFLVDSVLRFFFRDRSRSAWKALTTSTACFLLPPLRMGCRGLSRPDHIWLPVLGWQKVDDHLSKTLERFFSVPMLCFAFMVLPLFVLEYYWAEQVRSEPTLSLSLDIGTAVIWLAFAVELILMVAVAARPVRYCLSHWIDVAVVLLPAIEVMPLFRLLRLGRVLRLEQLLRWGRLQRLQAVAMRGWRAMLLLQLVSRLTGRSLERQLQQLQELRQAREEELAGLVEEIKQLEEKIAQKATSRAAAVSSRELRRKEELVCGEERAR